MDGVRVAQEPHTDKDEGEEKEWDDACLSEHVLLPSAPAPGVGEGAGTEPEANGKGGWGPFVSKEYVRSVLSDPGHVILDARGSARFRGEVEEARPGLRSGHMPGAKNLPFQEILDGSLTGLRGLEDLKAAFEKRGVDLEGGEGEGQRIVCTCGSGVTACVLAAGLEKVGVDRGRVAVYDGSWAEWGAWEGGEVVKGD